MLSRIKDFLKNNSLMFSVVGLVGLSGMIVFYHSPSSFRFTISVCILGVLLLYFQQLPLISTSLLSGCVILIIRSITYLIVDWNGALVFLYSNYSTVLYYFAYGFCFRVLQIRRYVRCFLPLLLLLSLADIMSNFAQIGFRAYPLPSDYQIVFSSMIGAAIMRSTIIICGYYAAQKYRNSVLEAEQLAHYHQLTIIISQLKAELYYLKKSSYDIEMIMEKSYSLYKELLGSSRKEDIPINAERAVQALSIARCIHEVKKDYYRVINGIDNTIRPSAQEASLLISNVFVIIEKNTNIFLNNVGKKIQVEFAVNADFPTSQHYVIVSILNNLIVNSIEACVDNCLIRVTQDIDDDEVIFLVEDNGCGIKKRNFPLLFNPGYSTKFCKTSGKMSTGLGLVHIENLTNMLDGKILFDSEHNKKTYFKIVLPLKKLIETK